MNWLSWSTFLNKYSKQSYLYMSEDFGFLEIKWETSKFYLLTFVNFYFRDISQAKTTIFNKFTKSTTREIQENFSCYLVALKSK